MNNFDIWEDSDIGTQKDIINIVIAETKGTIAVEEAKLAGALEELRLARERNRRAREELDQALDHWRNCKRIETFKRAELDEHLDYLTQLYRRRLELYGDFAPGNVVRIIHNEDVRNFTTGLIVDVAENKEYWIYCKIKKKDGRPMVAEEPLYPADNIIKVADTYDEYLHLYYE